MSDNGIRWGHVGSIGGLALVLYLLLVGATAIPEWVEGVLARVAGILILVGR